MTATIESKVKGAIIRYLDRKSEEKVAYNDLKPRILELADSGVIFDLQMEADSDVIRELGGDDLSYMDARDEAWASMVEAERINPHNMDGHAAKRAFTQRFFLDALRAL